MCYIDPPFFSNKNYEILWGNGYELRSFGDRWKGGVKSYIVWMEERVKEIHRILKDTGSIFLHCDWHASHRLRVMLDDVFGEKNFVNEIIWFYKTGGASKRFFARKHDSIFFYSKNDKYKYHPTKEKSYMLHKYGFKKSDFKIDKSNGLQYTHVYSRDVWEIPSVGSATSERIGYKTQKPEKLIERILKCSTNENDLILDCFGGGGTTAAVAAKLGRRFITGDVSPVATRVIAKRLNSLDTPPIFRVECSQDQRGMA